MCSLGGMETSLLYYNHIRRSVANGCLASFLPGAVHGRLGQIQIKACDNNPHVLAWLLHLQALFCTVFLSIWLAVYALLNV